MSDPNTHPNNLAEIQASIVKKIASLPQVLAVIEGRDLGVSLYAEMLMKSLKPEQLSSFVEASDEDIKSHAKQFIEGEVNNVLVQLTASKEGYGGSAEEVLADFDLWHSSLSDEDRSKFEGFLEKQKISYDDYRTKTGNDEAQQRRLSTDRWVREKVVEGVEVTQEEVEAAYDQGKAQNCTSPDMVKVAHIPFRHDQSDESREECRKKAEVVLEKLQGGATFEDMVKENPSSDGHLQRMGVLDFFAAGTYNQKFEEAAFSLAQDEISEIVDTGDGYEVIKCLEVKKGEVTPLSDVEEEIRQGLKGQKVNLRIGKLVDESRPQFDITYHI